MSLMVSFKSKVPFPGMPGGGYCLWQYEVEADTPAEITGQLGLGFSSALDIQDPADFPDTPELKGTRLEKRSPGFIQFVYAATGHAEPNKVSLSFVASC